MNEVDRPTRRECGLALLGYLIATAIIFAPVLGQFWTHEFTTGQDDGLDFRWKVWWVRHAVVERGQAPFHTNLLWHPEGTWLWLDALSPINGLQSILLTPFLGETAAFNFLVLEGFVLGGWFYHWFVRTMVGNGWAAFLAGLMYTFSPYHFSHMHGHLNFITIQFVPLFLWTLSIGMRRCGWRWPIAAGSALLLTAWSDLLYLVFAIPLAGLLLAGRWLETRGTKSESIAYWVFIARFILAATVLVGPIVAATSVSLATVKHEPGHDPRQFSADLLLYFGPGATSYWSNLTNGNWSRFVGNAAENAGGLGAICMAGCIGAVLRGSRQAMVWTGAAFCFAILSLGPELLIRGHGTGMSMPYGWLERMAPAISIAGTPVRIYFLAMLASNLAAAIGFDALFQWLAQRPTKRRTLLRNTTGAALAIAVIAEFLPNGIPTSRIGLAPAEMAALRELRDRPGALAIATAPTHDNLWHKFYQTIHQRPIVGGFTSRVASYRLLAVRNHVLLPVLYGLHDPIPGIDYSKRLDELIDVDFILAVDAKRIAFARTLGLSASFASERFAIFRLPRGQDQSSLRPPPMSPDRHR